MSVADLAITDPGALLAVPPSHGVDVWIVYLEEDDMLAESLVVDEADKVRLSRIIPPARRRRFLFRRAVQRHVLGRYAGSYRIRRSPSGKPHIVGADREIHFNASSSQDYCAVAVSSGAVGIDIVAASIGVDLADMCARFVPAFKLAEDASCTEAAKRNAGMWHWSRFEAAIKLRGGTLSHALTRTTRSRPAAEFVVSEPGFVCAVSKAVPFCLTRFAALSFADVVANAH